MRAVTKKRLRVLALVLLLGVLAVGWAVYDPCYCWVFEKDPNTPMHLKTLPTGCELLTLPQPFDVREDLADIEKIGGSATGGFEFRQSPDAADEVFVAEETHGEDDYKSRIPQWYSKLKYRFSFPALVGRVDERIHDIRSVSEQDWSRGGPLPTVVNEWGKELSFQGVDYASEGARYAGRLFPRTDRFYWIRPGLVTAGKQRIAVFSYGNSELKGNAVLDPDWLMPPRRTYTVDIYAVSSGARLALIRGWSCHGGELNSFAWHGEKLCSLPLKDETVLVCGFK
jgi:hypothetical protein